MFFSVDFSVLCSIGISLLLCLLFTQNSTLFKSYSWHFVQVQFLSLSPVGISIVFLN